MSSRLFSALCVLAFSGCSSGAAASNWTKIDSGNAVLDRFLVDVREKDASAISQAASFKNISQWLPQYGNAVEYLAFIDDCSLASVKRADNHQHIYWAHWACADGEFRQAFNVEYEKPKVMVSEMLVVGQDKRREKSFD